MRVFFGQVYISPGVRFPFSVGFQRYLSSQITELVEPCSRFATKYGEEFNLIFNVSAKNEILENKVNGPAVYRKTSDVEYTVFLPFDVIQQSADPIRAVLEHLSHGVEGVLGRLEIDAAGVASRRGQIIDEVCADPAMLDL